jgi:HSP20 family protein
MMMMSKKGKNTPAVTEENFFLESNSLMDEFLTDVPEAAVDGELAVDVYETAKEMIVKAPVAGVDPSNIDITITDDMVMVRGERVEEKEVDESSYYLKECYWGSFSRTVNLPSKGIPDEAQADFRNGILTIRVPKAETNKLRKIKVNMG